MKTLILVSCTKLKLDNPAPAKDLYSESDWFTSARAYAEAFGDDWRILSGKHALVHPDTVLEPYNEALSRAPVVVRKAWSLSVVRGIAHNFNCQEWKIVILAGQAYRQYLTEWLKNYGYEVEEPLAHVSGLGKQMAWLNDMVLS